VARGTILPVAHRTCDDPEVAVTVEQTIATLRERFARARVAQESRAAAVRARLQAMVAEQLPAGVSAWLIGSLAWGGFGPRSDVDLVLGGATPAQACRLEVRLTQALKLVVDVLRLEELPASFRERVEQQGVPLHGG
jgi:predicted nucleotidyltransferase